MLKKLILLFCLIFVTTIQAAPEKPLIVVLDWFINPNHAPLFVAEQEGFFKAEKLEVKFISPAETNEAEKMVAANQADIALTYQPTLIQKIQAGLPLQHFATLIDRPLDALIVLENGPIHSIKDLPGKKIGYSTPGTDHLILKTMLEYNGLSLHDVELINVRFDLTQALLAGKIAAFTGGSRNFEPIAMELAGKPARMFYPETNGMAKYAELILVINNNHANDPRLKKFLLALNQGLHYLRHHPQRSWLKFARNHPELNNELNRRAWIVTLPYFTHDLNSP